MTSECGRMSLSVPCLIQLVSSPSRFLRLLNPKDFCLFPFGEWVSTSDL